MISPRITRVNATVQLLAGLVLLFAADNVLALIAPGIPASANWIGQVLGGALIALAVMNWLNRTALLGGIYGRSVVLSNAVLYIMTASTMSSAVRGRDHAPVALWIVFAIASLLAVVYGALLMRGPIESDLAAYQRPHATS